MSALFLLFIASVAAVVLFIGLVFGSGPKSRVAETPDEDPRGTEVPPTPNNPDREGVYYDPDGNMTDCPKCGEAAVAVVEAWELGVDVKEADFCTEHGPNGGWPRRYYIHA